MSDDFGDFDDEDAFDGTGHAEAFQVARILHDELAHLDPAAAWWADLPAAHQAVGEALMDDLLPYEAAHDADPIDGAHHLQDVRNALDPLAADRWDDLTDEERQLAIDLVRDVLATLRREGTALT
jgi:hypothetical protein